MSSLVGAPMVIIFASSNYFKSKSCLIELGASIRAQGEVYYLLASDMSIENVPIEARWLPWRYSYDEEVLQNIKKSVDESTNIDMQQGMSEPKRYLASTSRLQRCRLNKFRNNGATLLDSRPLFFNPGTGISAFALSVWKTSSDEVVAVYYADTDQMSPMNNDKIIDFLKDKYSADRVFAVWPETDWFGVQEQFKGGNPHPGKASQLEDLGIPALTTGISPKMVRNAENYFRAPWLEECENSKKIGRYRFLKFGFLLYLSFVLIKEFRC
ncbi:hypothetical protein BM477_00330 [Boudabousia marimammalium]|uniref:TIR domain-containing protein n=2 Tax=Boudabousia marimammalium TaxID=156892 RepID=A0A1Q5PSW3_9ACTO|nr:hypothetical protein BM477_00330 [Boudabousia marimammalium]